MNSHELVCPKCGASDKLDVSARIWVRLVNDGTDQDLAHNLDHEWDDDSPCYCGACGWTGTVRNAANPDGAQAIIDGLVEALADLGFGDDDEPVNGGDCVDVICQHFDSLAALASKRFLPPRFAELRAQISVGSKVLSIEGEMSNTDAADDVFTGPNAIGVIDSIDDDQENCIVLAFEPSGVSVVLSLAELADEDKYTVNPDERG